MRVLAEYRVVRISLQRFEMNVKWYKHKWNKMQFNKNMLISSTAQMLINKDQRGAAAVLRATVNAYAYANWLT